MKWHTIAAPLFLLLSAAAPPPSHLLEKWNTFEKGVRDGKIVKEEAKNKLEEVVAGLREEYDNQVAVEEEWAFPVADGRPSYIGGKGKGFHPKTPKPAYSWYDGNRHGGHPAHDIFIPHDKDNDCLNDQTKQPYHAVAMQPAVVVSVNEEWKPGKPRGGKYVWLYNPKSDMFFYYAHLNDVFVRPGDIVDAVRYLGVVGKTGFTEKNSDKPCHIHLMVLKYEKGKMMPYDYFSLLKNRK